MCHQWQTTNSLPVTALMNASSDTWRYSPCPFAKFSCRLLNSFSRCFLRRACKVVRGQVSDDVACTIHVYGGYMEKCQVFSPVAQGTNDGDGSEGGLYRRESKSLFFTPKPWSNMCG